MTPQDMVVSLHGLPPLEPELERMRAAGIVVRRALPTEALEAERWADEHFRPWVPELRASFARLPITCFLALREARILGFAAWDTTFPNFFGPTGVVPDARGQRIGRALLIAALHAQRSQGYAYAIIGGVGPAAFYEKNVGAVLLDGEAAFLRERS